MVSAQDSGSNIGAPSVYCNSMNSADAIGKGNILYVFEFRNRPSVGNFELHVDRVY